MSVARIIARLGALLTMTFAYLLLNACSITPPPMANLEPTLWQEYKQAFISDDGRVIDIGNNGVSHSEGQGYGMLLAAAANDRATFDQLWSWTRRNLNREHDPFFSYRWDGSKTPAIQDKNNASDGELLIAWALARAGQRWGDDAYIVEARVLAEAIRAQLLRSSAMGVLLLPGMHGFEHPGYFTVNPSYWIFPAFQALERIDPSPEWRQLEKSGRALLTQARFGAAKLTPDWVRVRADGRLELGEDQFSRFSYDALRIPLYSCWSKVENKDLLAAMATQWNAPSNPAWINLKTGEIAPYALSPSQQVMNRILLGCLAHTTPAMDNPSGVIIKNDYYASTLALLGEIALRERAQ